MPLTVQSFGPFGSSRALVVDRASSLAVPDGAVKRARNAVLSGAGALMARSGTTVVATLLDDQATPAPVTSVCAIVPFAAGTLLVAHSTTTQKVYLYTADADLGSVTRVGVLWDTVATPPVVWIAEGLGVAYIAHGEAASAAALLYPLRTWDGTALATPTADLDGTGAHDLYPSGAISFHNHCVTWGFDAGATAATAYKPEGVRIGGINFDAFDSDSAKTDAFSVGHRVRSPRERIWAACVAGEVCYLGMPYGLWALSGYSRDTWQVTSLDELFGVIAPKAMVAVGGVCYYWSHRGPMRVSALGSPEPLWDAIPELVASVVDAQKTVAVYDAARDQVLFLVSTGAGVRQVAAFDVQREVWLGPDSDVRVHVGAAGSVAPVIAATATAPGPDGPPTGFAGVLGSQWPDGAGTDTATTWTWTAGDTHPGTVTELEFQLGAGASWTHQEMAASVTSDALTVHDATGAGLVVSARVRHVRNGQATAWATASVTIPPAGGGGGGGTTLAAPTDLVCTWLGGTSMDVAASWTIHEPTAATELVIARTTGLEPPDTNYSGWYTAPVGVSWAQQLAGDNGTYWFKARHVLNGAVSPWTAAVSVEIPPLG